MESSTTFKPLLLRLLQDVYEVQQAWLGSLSQEEQHATGVMGRWSSKDHLAHLTFWRRHLVSQLETALREQEPLELPELDETNAYIFRQYRDRPLADILRESQEAHQKLIAMVKQFSEESLATQRYPWMHTSDSLGVAIMGRGYAHPLEHIAQYYLDRNHLARATQIHERLVDQIIHTSVPDSAKGISLYNLACFYATHNILDKVAEKLMEALHFYPRLKEWALNDPDLVVVRHLIK